MNINYQSDFKVAINSSVSEYNLHEVESWELRLRTPNSPSTFVAQWRRYGESSNIVADGDGFIIPVKNHQFCPGKLKGEFVIVMRDLQFSGGIRTEVVPFDTDICLTTQASDYIAENVNDVVKIALNFDVSNSLGQPHYHIAVEIRKTTEIGNHGHVYLIGAEPLIEAGYTPYLFRHLKKRCADRIIKKGWKTFGSWQTLRIRENDGCVMFIDVPNWALAAPPDGHGYTTEIDALISGIYTDASDIQCLRWGRAKVALTKRIKRDGVNVDVPRMLRMPVAIGFAKRPDAKIENHTPITTADLVTNLATFSLIYAPTSDSDTWVWRFGR